MTTEEAANKIAVEIVGEPDEVIAAEVLPYVRAAVEVMRERAAKLLAEKAAWYEECEFPEAARALHAAVVAVHKLEVK